MGITLIEKKPYKSGGDFVRDWNGEKILLSRNQVMKRFKKNCANHGWVGLTNFYVKDAGDYWTTSWC